MRHDAQPNQNHTDEVDQHRVRDDRKRIGRHRYVFPRNDSRQRQQLQTVSPLAQDTRIHLATSLPRRRLQSRL